MIPGGQNLSKRQSVFFLPVDPRKEDHKDPEKIDYSVPRLARYLHNTWKRHQDTENWVDIRKSSLVSLSYHVMKVNNDARPELHQGPADLQSVALTTEL